MIELKSVQRGDPYDAVLADLRAKREEIDKTITLLESLRDERLGVAPAQSQGPVAEDDTPSTGMFLGMSIVDAAKKLLGMRKRTMTNSEILAELKAGGVVLTGADPLNVVGSVLTRRFNNVGDVVRVGRGIWGLKEWYPNRNFKPGSKQSQSDAPDDAVDVGGEANDFDGLLG